MTANDLEVPIRAQFGPDPRDRNLRRGQRHPFSWSLSWCWLGLGPASLGIVGFLVCHEPSPDPVLGSFNPQISPLPSPCAETTL